MRKLGTLLLVLSISWFVPVPSINSQQVSPESARKLIRRVEPQYPLTAKKINLGGTVRVVAVVAPDGSVKKVEPVGGSPLLVQAAQSAVSQWKYAAGAESKELIELHFVP